ncbi:MAG: M23 family metallopeptidase [Pseudomonadota bacterium]|nr:M23 family metallopeptidase [Pseudomonadota bacterium]
MLPESLRFPPGGKPWLLYGLFGASLVLNLALAVKYSGGDEIAPEEPGQAESAPIVAPIGDETTISNPSVPANLVAPLPEPLGVARAAGTEVFTGVVTSSLSVTFQAATAANPAALTAVYARLFAWDVDLRRDLHKGDTVEVLYEQPDGAEPLVLAARLRSQPGTGTEKVFSAWRYQAPGDRFPSYWSDTGEEVPRRLIDGPLPDYEQITSLLKDRPTHEGMDFKTPIGTPIVAPRAGRVTRTNWNHAANGNCVEVQFSDGATAKFLHMNENGVKDGQTLSAGTEIGKTGNTGRSTGPHLHYQLERGGRVLDPTEYHGTLRRQLPPDAMPGFEQARKELAEQLDGRLASR